MTSVFYLVVKFLHFAMLHVEKGQGGMNAALQYSALNRLGVNRRLLGADSSARLLFLEPVEMALRLRLEVCIVF